MKLKIESTYAVSILATTVIIYSILFALLDKYYSLTLSHFIDGCKMAILDFFFSSTHIYGLLTVTLIVTASILLTTRSVVTFIKTRKKISKLLNMRTNKRSYKLCTVLEKLNISSMRVVVIQSEKQVAFSYGLIQPKILISTGITETLSNKQLEAVLLHEYYHIKNSHVFLFLLSEVVNSLLFFIPTISALIDKVRLTFEIKADKAVILNQGTNKHLRLALAKTLSPVPHFSINPYFSADHLEQRIGKLLNKKVNTSFKKREILFSTFVVLFLFTLFTLPTKSHAHEIIGGLNTQPSCKDRNISYANNLTPRSINFSTIK